MKKKVYAEISILYLNTPEIKITQEECKISPIYFFSFSNPKTKGTFNRKGFRRTSFSSSVLKDNWKIEC